VSRSLLAGLGLRLVAGPGRAVDLASAFLRSVGADVTVSAPDAAPPAGEGRSAGRGGGHRPAGRLLAPAVATADVDPGAGLPTSTLDLAVGMALAGGALAATRLPDGPTAPSVAVDPDAVAAHVLLPLVLAAAADLGPPATPPPPRPTADGAVCADLAVEGDDAAFGRLLRTGPGAGTPGSMADAEVLGLWSSEELAAQAQGWRLPVTPYRRRDVVCVADEHQRAGTVPFEPAGPASLAPAAPRARRRLPLEDVTVADLTIMWSGPLATWLLCRLGARVVKVEPDCRLDGTRFSPGGQLFDALNAGKERAPLDLRREPDRQAFRDLVVAADLVVDNFSPRVAPNLGITHDDLAAVNPSVLSLSLPAFPPGPERHWVSYGTGVHAVSGLGDAGTDGFAAPIVTYPDPVGGITAAAAALVLIVARDRGARPGHAEVALADAVGPLRGVPDDGALLRRPDPALPGWLARRLGTPPPSPLRPEAG
jgi:hypothetical protein